VSHNCGIVGVGNEDPHSRPLRVLERGTLTVILLEWMGYLGHPPCLLERGGIRPRHLWCRVDESYRLRNTRPEHRAGRGSATGGGATRSAEMEAGADEPLQRDHPGANAEDGVVRGPTLGQKKAEWVAGRGL